MKLTKTQLKRIIKEELEEGGYAGHHIRDEYGWETPLEQAMYDIKEIYVSIENEAQLGLFMEKLREHIDKAFAAWEEERGPITPYHR